MLAEGFSSPSLSEMELTIPLPCKALETGLNDLPLGGIDHEGDLGDFRLGCEELQVTGHGGDAVDHAFIHADVDHVGAVLDLLTRYR